MYTNYTMNQTCLPIEMNAFLPQDHIVYAIHEAVEELAESRVQLVKNDLGRPAYHPKVLLKVLLFAYSEGVFSGRKIERMMQENMAMQWIASQEQISYRTINRFRVSEEMTALLKELYCTFTSRLKAQGLIAQREVFIDGTKLEANANKYTFVWKKATDKYTQRLKEKEARFYEEELAPLISQEIRRDHESEFSLEDVHEWETIIEEELAEVETAIETTKEKEEASRLKKKRRRLKKYRRRLEKDFLPREKKYAAYSETFNGRNSFSKTDPDATFMRMKDDHMQNGQLKAGYNIQIATENQFVLHTQIYPNPTDTRTLIPFLESIPKELLPSHTIVADAGYGSQENLEYLEKTPLNPFIKYNLYETEKKRTYKESDRNLENWTYLEEENVYVHPDGTRYPFGYIKRKKTSSGFITRSHVYVTTDPEVRNGRKTLYVNLSYEQHKQKMRDKLSSEMGRLLYAKRKIDVEPVFGQVKANLGFTRLSVRGKEKVANEVNLVFMANNLRKYSLRRRKKT